MSKSLQPKLQAIFDADRALREAQQAFFDDSNGSDDARVSTLSTSLEQAQTLDDLDERASRLSRIADLLTDLAGEPAAKLLTQLLDDDDPSVRLAAGEGLIDLAYSRYAEIARVFEALIEDGRAIVALREVPLLLAQVGEPGGVKLCTKLLKHSDADVVASAIQALVELGDPASAREIDKLKGDTRMVTADDEADDGSYTVGDLVSDALDELRPPKN